MKEKMNTARGTVRAVSKIVRPSTVRKMINRFLSCNRVSKEGKVSLRYTKEELAVKIGVSVEEIERIKEVNSLIEVDNKIVLPLIHLYCSTKWADD